MASKVPIKPLKPKAAATPAGTEPEKQMAPTPGGGMVRVTSLLPQHDLNEEVEAADSGSFLPLLKLVYPIEIRPSGPYKQNHAYAVGLTNSETFEELEAGYILSVLDSRNASREERETEEGGKEYIRAFQEITRGDKAFSKTHEAYVDQHKRAMLKEEGFLAGVSVVLAVLRADGSVAIAEMNLFKTQRAYWQKHLLQTSVLRGVGMQVKIKNHFDNVIESGGGLAYPGPKKFNQFDFVQLEQEQVAAVGTALEEVGEAYLQWLGR